MDLMGHRSTRLQTTFRWFSDVWILGTDSRVPKVAACLIGCLEARTHNGLNAAWIMSSPRALTEKTIRNLSNLCGAASGASWFTNWRCPKMGVPPIL
jgi:hypothetical protein